MPAAGRPQKGLSAVTDVKVATARRQMRSEREAAAPVVRALKERPEAWIDFMMRFEWV